MNFTQNASISRSPAYSFGYRAGNLPGTFDAQTRVIMKMKTLSFGMLIVLTVLSASGQGTFLFDQQSSTDEVSSPPGRFQLPPFAGHGDGESFTPTLSSVGFIRLMLYPLGSGQSGHIYCNLCSDSIYGPIIGTTESVLLADNFGGPVSLQFANPVAVTPGSTYYFEAVVEHSWAAGIGQYNYPGGSLFLAGTPEAVNFWFREGIIVPEPSTIGLLTIAAVLLFYSCRLSGRSLSPVEPRVW